MIRKIQEIVPKWTIVSLLLFTQVQAEGAYYDQNYASPPCNSCGYCECGDRFWVDAEYLYWKIKNSPQSTPLVYEGPTVDPVPQLGDAGTSVVLGGKSIDNKWRSGGKITLGYWFDDSQCLGLEGSYFFLPSGAKSQSVSSDGSANSALLRIPFFDVVTSLENSGGLAQPDVFSGFASLKLANKMQGAELNVLAKFPSCGEFDLVGLAGFRYWNFQESLSFTTDSPFVFPPFDVYKTKDKFNVDNNFYGGQVGLILGYNSCNFSARLRGNVALGAMCEEVNINGHLLTNDYNNFGDPQTYSGGYFALPTNIGKHKQTKFAIIPEINLSLGYQVFDCMKIVVGYTGIYVSNMLWAGQQIDRNINPSQSVTYSDTSTPVLVGEERPRASLKTDSLWVQGLNVGLVFQF